MDGIHLTFPEALIYNVLHGCKHAVCTKAFPGLKYLSSNFHKSPHFQVNKGNLGSAPAKIWKGKGAGTV